MFVAKPGSQAAASTAFAIGLNDFIGGQKLSSVVFFKTNILGISVDVSMIQLVAIMMIVIFTTLNCASVMLSGQIATILTGVKIALILFVGIGAFVWVTGDFSHFSLINSGGTCEGVSDSVKYGSPSYSFIGGFGAAMLGALWGYDGWNNLTFVAGEVKDPNRNIPIAIIGSTVLVILLYVFVHLGYFYVLDPTTIPSLGFEGFVGREDRRGNVLWRERGKPGNRYRDRVLHDGVDALLAQVPFTPRYSQGLVYPTQWRKTE